MHSEPERPIPLDQRYEDRSPEHLPFGPLLHRQHQEELRPGTQSGHVVMHLEVREPDAPVEHPQFVGKGRLEAIWLHLHKQYR